MRYRLTVFLAALTAAATLLAAPAPCAAAEPGSTSDARSTVEAIPVPVDEDLRMGGGAGYSANCGLIASKEELGRFWSGLISAKNPYTSRLGIGLPDPPEVDFGTYSLIWFGDRGEVASVVDDISVGAYSTDNSLFITILVYHPDTGNNRVHLWKVPVTGYRPVFNVLHKYEEEK